MALGPAYNRPMNSDDWDKRYQEKKLVWSAGPNQFLVNEVTGLSPGRALDVACGEGRNALWLAERGWDVTAFDFSPVAIEKARARSAEVGANIDWRVADATADIDGTYDLILYLYLHLPREQIKASLALAKKALAPGGTLLIVGHDIRNIKEGIGGPQDASILFGPQDFEAMLADLQIEKAETVKREVRKDDQVYYALDVLVRAH